MKAYKKILLAVGLESKGDKLLIQKAQQLQTELKAEIILIHAVEYLLNYGAAYAVVPGVDIESMLIKEAQKALKAIGNKLDVDEKNQIIEVGSAKHVILEQADKKDIDLIIVGSHGRHGIRLLLGSTANGVLHGAKCDVLAVRVKD